MPYGGYNLSELEYRQHLTEAHALGRKIGSVNERTWWFEQIGKIIQGGLVSPKLAEELQAMCKSAGHRGES